MKNIKILVTVILVSFFSIQNMNAQDKKKGNENTKVFKTTKEKTPTLVKQSLKDYKGYKISNQVTYVRKRNTNVYKFKVQKGNWSHYLLINEKGKIIGIETGEHSIN